jgi:hypothetical protein
VRVLVLRDLYMLPNAMPRWVLCVLGFYRGRKIRAAHYTYFRKLSNVLFTNPENFLCVTQHSRTEEFSSLWSAAAWRRFGLTTQRYVRATERNKREAVQAAMLNSRGHNLATRVNAIVQTSAVA